MSYMSSVFGNTVGYALQGYKFTKTLIDCRLFPQIILSKTVNFWSKFRKESFVKPTKPTTAVALTL